ncbi:hypothetical protein [Paenibacillus koleovorans]|uniref:hypothetical protein n=1 Tax=Paenibacillus koleovorans TaxID=121608 RepID=UPI001FE37373|nr:hypothetical protein [Paenibacillus koleovorans]
MTARRIRFLERDYYRRLMLTSSEQMTEDQVEKILDMAGSHWEDLTFKFYDNGAVEVIDNHTDLPVRLADLKGAAYDCYVRERIRSIRTNLQEKILQTA